MFDNNIFIKGSCKNILEKDKVTGFELKTHIPYYRGIPLSMVNDIHVHVDDHSVQKENIFCSIDYQDWFSLDELPTVTSYKWEYGEPLYIQIRQEGGLSSGVNNVELTVSVRTAYIPVPLVGTSKQVVTI